MDLRIINSLINEINDIVLNEIKIMEICGTHTQMIAKYGLKSVLTSKIKLISGPGCPVCVTEESYIDSVIDLLQNKNIVVAAFGDITKVKGSRGDLLEEKRKGKDIRIIYSPLSLIEIAEKNKDKIYVFLAVGFETTAPVIALAVKIAAERNINNLFFLTSLKRMPPILHYILNNEKNNIDGIICPGHVASVTGSEYFKFISQVYKIPSAVCGFREDDIIIGIYFLIKQITQSKSNEFCNLYKRCVKQNGNLTALKLINDVFEITDGMWRGIGRVENSSFKINDKYNNYDAFSFFNLKNKTDIIDVGCQCKDILLGNKIPEECNLFKNHCTPSKPYGPCMVSDEGSCSVAYKYGG